MIPGGRSLERDLGFIWDLFGIKPSRKGFAGVEGQGGKLQGNDPVFPALLPPTKGWGGHSRALEFRDTAGEHSQENPRSFWVQNVAFPRLCCKGKIQMTENKEWRHSCSRGGDTELLCPSGNSIPSGKGLEQLPVPSSTRFSGDQGIANSFPMGIAP